MKKEKEESKVKFTPLPIEELHWVYTKAIMLCTMTLTGVDVNSKENKDLLAILGFIYKEAFAHGVKHGRTMK